MTNEKGLTNAQGMTKEQLKERIVNATTNGAWVKCACNGATIELENDGVESLECSECADAITELIREGRIVQIPSSGQCRTTKDYKAK